MASDPGEKAKKTSKSIFKPKGSLASFFSRKSSHQINNPLTKDTAQGHSRRPSIFQNLRRKGKSAPQLEKPDHPAYGLPGENIPSLAKPDIKSTVTPGNEPTKPLAESTKSVTESKPAEKRRASIANLIDTPQPGRTPLFSSNTENDVPDAAPEAADTSEHVSSWERKGKSAHRPSSPPLPDLPLTYQIRFGIDAYKSPIYNHSSLYTGKPVRELWDPVNGDALIYLCPKSSTPSRDPSFLVDSSRLTTTSDYWRIAFSQTWQSGFSIDHNIYPGAQFALFFPPDRPDGRNEEKDPVKLLRHYVTMRNVFACIFDSFCVGILEEDSPLLSDLVDRMLEYFDGSDGSIGARLQGFILKSGLWDVTNDPDKAVDLLHLAATYEMKELYMEAFVHCVGMWPQIEQNESYLPLSASLINLLKSRHTLLQASLKAYTKYMKHLTYKPLWSLSSPTLPFPIQIRQAFEETRIFLYRYFAATGFPTWPPKGLATRVVINRIYGEICALYRLLVDRQYTTEVACYNYPGLVKLARTQLFIDTELSGHGVSLPYGIPLLPGYFVQVLPGGNNTDGIRRVETFNFDINEKKMTEAQFEKVMGKMYNDPEWVDIGISQDRNILTAFMAFERGLMKGKDFRGIINARKGVWLQVYALLSVMAELTVEDGVVFKEGVEYLLSADTEGCFDLFEKDEEDEQEEEGSSGDSLPEASTSTNTRIQPPPPGKRVRFPIKLPETTDTSSSDKKKEGGGEKMKRVEKSYPFVLARSLGFEVGMQRGTG